MTTPTLHPVGPGKKTSGFVRHSDRLAELERVRPETSPRSAGPDEKKGLAMMNSSGTNATADLGLRLVVPGSTTVPLVARLEYTAADPYAVTVAFHVGEDEPVEWIFARELLTVGIMRQAGEGDVRVWPSEEDGERALSIALSSPFGHAEFSAPVPPLVEFLHRTYEIVAAGHEAEFVDLDTEIEEHILQ